MTRATRSPPPRIVAVSGSMGDVHRLRRLVEVAAEAAREAGAEVRLIDLNEVRLPLFENGTTAQDSHPEVLRIREASEWADGFILGTPEYHGNIGGALKNWFDFHYPELAGKLAAVVAVCGGTSAELSIASTKASFHACHGFTLPFNVFARDVDFSPEWVLVNDRVRERARRLGRDVARYAPVLRAAFAQARGLGKGEESGFAGYHA
ncbi:MAG: NAD(P)H-dependent oxidoreductase [Planctomycetes bacterium]|nr:NAD(P)H-dependent oxidoreductase [Planctomycetota bacterium]